MDVSTQILGIPDGYSTWYLTLNKGRLSSYFQIMIPGRVICRSLMAIIAHSGIVPRGLSVV